MIGSYSVSSEEPDKVHIKFNGEPVISGPSLKGVICSSAYKIT